MDIIQHKSGEVEINGPLEELESVDEFLALLHKVGADITTCKSSETHAVLELDDGRALIGIENLEVASSGGTMGEEII